MVLMSGQGPTLQTSKPINNPCPQQNRKTWALHILELFFSCQYS